MKKVVLIVFFASSILKLSAQEKQVTRVEQIWAGYFLQAKLSKDWGLWTDIHLRTKDDYFNQFSQSIVRLGLTRYLNPATKLTVGYAYVNHFPAASHPNISLPEHRSWQQLQWHTNYGKNKLMQWIRLEQRFRSKATAAGTIADDWGFNQRIRYNILWSVPLSSKGFAPNSFAFLLNDEIHINLGKEIVYNTFDQNRFFIGLGYQANKHTQIQLGYMNVFQQMPAVNSYRDAHNIRLFVFQNIDLSRH